MKRDNVRLAKTEHFAYGALNRLKYTNFDNPAHSGAYRTKMTYSLNGNIASNVHAVGHTSNWGHMDTYSQYGNGTNAGPHAVTSAGGMSYTYDQQTYNRYTYVRNNPLSRVDPSG